MELMERLITQPGVTCTEPSFEHIREVCEFPGVWWLRAPASTPGLASWPRLIIHAAYVHQYPCTIDAQHLQQYLMRALN